MSRRIFSKQAEPRQRILSTAEEREYEREVSKLKQLENATRALQKDIKQHTDFVSGLAKCEKQLVTDLKTFCGALPAAESTELRAVVDPWFVNLPQLEAACLDMVTVAPRTLGDSMKRLDEVYEHIHVNQKRRDACLQECNKFQLKVEKYREKESTGPNLAKKAQSSKALSEAKQHLLSHQSVVLNDIPHVYKHRMEYCQPGVAAFISSEVEFDSAVAAMSGEDNVGPAENRGQPVSQWIDQLKTLSTVTADGS